jgi:hypothetical protein
MGEYAKYFAVAIDIRPDVCENIRILERRDGDYATYTSAARFFRSR